MLSYDVCKPFDVDRSHFTEECFASVTVAFGVVIGDQGEADFDFFRIRQSEKKTEIVKCCVGICLYAGAA